MVVELFVLFVVLVLFYLLSKLIYYKSISDKEHKNSIVVKKTLKEAEIIIRKYQLQFIKSINSSENIIEELNLLKNEVSTAKQKNIKYSKETNVLRSKLTDMKSKLESLI